MSGNRTTPCSICSRLKDYERGFQVGGRTEDDTFLPPEAMRLKTIKDLNPKRNPTLELVQCPECQTYYTYQTEYEYLAFGSEDEQILSRLTTEQALKYLDEKQGPR